MNKFYTAQEVADKLKIKKATVYELIKRGEMESSKVGKQLRISEEQLEQYLSRSTSADADPSDLHSFQPESSLLKRDYLLHSSGLILSGQTSPALELLLSRMAAYPKGLPVLQTHMNTYNSLYSLYFEKVHIACAGMFAEDIRQLVPGIPVALLCLYEFPVGFYVKKENPQKILGIEDLARTDVVLANREKGSTRRIFLDQQLKKAEISANAISGYYNELVSDLSTASAVASGRANAAVGEKYVSDHTPEIDFLPLDVLPMYLVLHRDSLKKPGFSPLLDIVRSENFKTDLTEQTGYDTSRTGELLLL